MLAVKATGSGGENEKSRLSETRSTVRSGSLFRLLMVGCVSEGRSGSVERGTSAKIVKIRRGAGRL